MKPKQNQKKASSGDHEFERVKVDEWTDGVIAEVQYDEKHSFGGKFAGIQEGVRFKFDLDGYKFPHYSRWMKFSYSDKSNLFTKYLAPLVVNAQPYLDFDISRLQGLKIKTMWSEEKGSNGQIWQSLELIRPLEGGVNPFGDSPISHVEPDPALIDEKLNEMDANDEITSEDDGIPF